MPRIRRVQLFIGPFKDLLDEGRAGAKLIDSSGLSRDLKISFRINKTLTGAPNETEIVITNLSPDTRKLLREPNLSIELWGGYEDEGLRILAKGGILSSVPARKEELIETTIIARDGWGPLLNADFASSYSANEPLSNVVKRVALSIPGVKIGRIEIKSRLSSKGRTLSGDSRTVLNKLADQFAFSWSIQDGIFQALDDDHRSNTIYDLKNTLLEVTPTLLPPLQLLTGVNIVSLLDSRMIPGDSVRIDPTTDENLKGLYKIFSMTMIGGTHDDNWTNTITSKVLV